MLFCEYDDEFADWFYMSPADFSILDTSRRKRCCSCKTLIEKNAVVLKFKRFRYFRTEIEEKIYGDSEIGIAAWYMCEPCGDQYMNLSSLGFCIDLEENMFDLLKEYQERAKEEVRR